MFAIRPVLAAAAVGVLALGACSGDDSSSDTTAVPSEATTVDGSDNGGETTPPDTGAPSRDVVISVAVDPGSTEGIEGALVDVSGFTCELQDGRWVVAGEVTNPLEEAASYRIYTSFLNAERVTYGLLEVPVERVEAGETVEWSGEIQFDEPDMECVLRVERLRLG